MPRLRTLLWVDCIGAAVVGVAMLALSGVLAPVLGVERGVLVMSAITNLVYGTCSFSLARHARPPRRWVRVLVAANATWPIVCAVIVVTIAGPASWLGVAYFAAEGVYVGALAVAEGAALRRERQDGLGSGCARSRTMIAS